MATNAAVKLINQLRFDPQVREHFNITRWDGKGTCKTVGCIAGTAILQMGERLYNRSDSKNLIDRAQEILGIEFHKTAIQLFMPWEHADRLTNWLGYSSMHLVIDQEEIEKARRRTFDYLPRQAQPDLTTVEKMLRWAKKRETSFRSHSDFSPDAAANALEQVTVKEMPFVNWAQAEAEAEAEAKPASLKEPV